MFLNSPFASMVKLPNISISCTNKRRKRYLMAVCSAYIWVYWTKLKSLFIIYNDVTFSIAREKKSYRLCRISWIRLHAWNKYRWTVTQKSPIRIYTIWCSNYSRLKSLHWNKHNTKRQAKYHNKMSPISMTFSKSVNISTMGFSTLIKMSIFLTLPFGFERKEHK